MILPRLRNFALAAVAALGLGGCTYDGYSSVGLGVGYGSGYGYGYGSGYCDPYWDDCYYSRRGLRYDPWYGWYDGFYYPGTGLYVYDRYRRPHYWNDGQRRYWEGRRHRWGDRNWGDRRWDRWDGYSQGRRSYRNYDPTVRQHFRQEDRQFRRHYRDELRSVRRGEVTPQQFREHRREENRAFREHRRSHRRGGQ